MLAEVDAAIGELDCQDVDHTAIAICQITKQRVGTSIGISPWTDYWLRHTFDRNKTKNLIVLLAHDWYPIVDKNGIWSINSPLFVDVPYGRYAKAFEPATRSRKYTALLFLNLVPDLRVLVRVKLGAYTGLGLQRLREWSVGTACLV